MTENPTTTAATTDDESTATASTETASTTTTSTATPEATDAANSNDASSNDSDDNSNDDTSDERSADPLEAEAEVAADYLEELLDIADLDGDIDTYSENGRAQVSIVTDSQVLVGPNGEVLEALQELVRLAVMAETDNRTRLMLDVAGFREKRRKELRVLAADAVQEVKDSGEAQRLAPMNPFERKIVHDAVAEAGLKSESEGEEPKRRVVVMPA
ncbi:protein jag [Microlunatus sp. Y2014]|uniref:Jag family protein n=1 Tax=Microlunatus sp. Y2014 TaxID=3418488 RepID=UPI003DA77C99